MITLPLGGGILDYHNQNITSGITNITNATTTTDITTTTTVHPITGDQISEQTVIRTVNFNRYEVQIQLTMSGTFVNIISIKVKKSFIEAMKNRLGSDVHDVEEYYREE